MASVPIPHTNVDGSYTIITQVIPSSSVPTTVQQNSSPTLSPLQKFLKGEPKALGTVQIMIGLLTILFGIVMVVYPQTMSVYSGVTFWGSLLHICTGSLAVSASNNLNQCVVKGAMGMNIFSTLSAGIAIIFLSLDLVIGPSYCYNYPYRFCDYITMIYIKGITGVLLVFSLLQFFISIILSAFTCYATCTNGPALNVINVVPNPAGHVPVNISTVNADPVNNPPAEYPPAYYEKNPPEQA